jgi:hypothetical protein
MWCWSRYIYDIFYNYIYIYIYITFNNPRLDSVRTGSDHSQSNMNMSDKSIALVLTLLLFVFLAQCKCLISSYSLSLNWFLICIYTLHPHEHIIYQVVLTRISMLELQGGKLLLASPDMEIVIKGGTKMEKWSTAAIQTTFFLL